MNLYALFPGPNLPEPAYPDPELVRMWREHVAPNCRDGLGDAEDWTEQAFRLRMAVDHGIPIVGLDHDVVAGDCVWGPERYWAHYRVETTLAANRYWYNPAFQSRCGRDIQIVDADEFVPVVAGLLAGGPVRYKEVHRTKTYLGVIRDLDDLHGEDVGWMLEHLLGVPEALAVYPQIDMQYEYRLFVVDGQVVTGAGCVESATPLDNRAPFDPLVEQYRGGRTSDRPDVVARLVKFGREAARDLHAHGITSCALDVCLSGGQPIIIECNGLPNAGLYASDPVLLGQAIVDHPEQFRVQEGCDVRCCG